MLRSEGIEKYHQKDENTRKISEVWKKNIESLPRKLLKNDPKSDQIHITATFKAICNFIEEKMLKISKKNYLKVTYTKQIHFKLHLNQDKA